ncbi:beta-lactam-binding protein with PASTA domain [Microbacterium resistens]|uniref:Beta-lactam-binding protein with PASTA domain n=2 Tax=Microbacterium resistens TaxID=156977 RepID=A0ABU1SF52_9MICO|nr:beta-lactam-binding protein with PASTA domain [Microbacterium resistens]
MIERRSVVIPDFVGKPVHVARDIAVNAGIDLASGDPDGPGLGSLTWPGLFWVTSQDPAAGTAVEPRTQVRITFLKDGQARSDVPAQTGGPLPSLKSHAEPEVQEEA